MTATRIRTSSGWVDLTKVGPQGPPGADGATGATGADGATGPTGPTGPSLLGVQVKRGRDSNYSANFTTDQNPLVDHTTGPLPMQIVFTPAVDAWWEVVGHIGLLQKMDAAYHVAYGALTLSPADADGVNSISARATQHSTVDTEIPRLLVAMFKLTAGVPYTALLGIVGISAGTWRYYRAASTLSIHGKAWTR